MVAVPCPPKQLPQTLSSLALSTFDVPPSKPPEHLFTLHLAWEQLLPPSSSLLSPEVLPFSCYVLLGAKVEQFPPSEIVTIAPPILWLTRAFSGPPKTLEDTKEMVVTLILMGFITTVPRVFANSMDCFSLAPGGISKLCLEIPSA